MSDKKFITTEVKVSFQIPRLPNFIQVYGKESVAIQDIDEKTLRLIGEKWTEALIEAARKKK